MLVDMVPEEALSHICSPFLVQCAPTLLNMREDTTGLIPPAVSMSEAQELSVKESIHTTSQDCCPWKGPLVKLALVGVWELGW